MMKNKKGSMINEQSMMKNEEWTKQQWIMNNEQVSFINKQWLINSEQGSMIHKKWTTNNEQVK